MRKERGYTLLARSSPLGTPVRATLWLGDDHLLHVRQHLTEDQYRRFYFKDIHWIRVFQDSRGLITCILLGLLVSTAAFFFLLSGSLAIRIFWSLIGVPSFILLLLYMSGGRSCSVWIGTAIGEMRLLAPSRMKQARRVLETIEPLIREAQADLEQELDAQQDESPSDAEASSMAPPEASPQPKPLPQAVPPPLPGSMPSLRPFVFGQMGLSLLLVLFGLGKALLMLHSSMPLLAAGLVLAFLYILGIVLMLIRQHRPGTPRPVIRMNWALLIAGVLIGLMLVAQSYILQFHYGEQRYTEWQAARLFVRLSVTEHNGIQTLGWVTAGTSLVFGMAGMLAIGTRRKTSRPQP